jgi:hypothetical protein
MRGLINVHYYYIPVKKVEGWDGDVLWLKVTENEVKENYERKKVLDPNQYYVKDYPYYNRYFRSLSLIPSKKRFTYYYDNLSKRNAKMSFKCNLCNKVFLSENELDEHIEQDKH